MPKKIKKSAEKKGKKVDAATILNLDIKDEEFENKIEKFENENPGALGLLENEKRLTLRRELFCRYYAGTQEFFGNGVKAYLEAAEMFRKPKEKPITYDHAKAEASRLLTNPNILKRIDQILENTMGQIGLNDQFVDKELLFCITQKGDMRSKIMAIKEFNALKQRVKKKVEVDLSNPFQKLLKEISGN